MILRYETQRYVFAHHEDEDEDLDLDEDDDDDLDDILILAWHASLAPTTNSNLYPSSRHQARWR
jgi:hypothetical protein